MNNAVYCLSCTKCPSTVYIGETGCGLADHFREHRRDVSNGRNHLPVPAHFNQANYTQEDMKAGVLNAGLANQEYSKKREMRLIFFLMGLWVLLALIKTFFLMWITHLLLTRAQASAVTQSGKRVGNEASTPLFKWCVMARALFPRFWCAQRSVRFSVPLQTNLIPTTASHLFALVSSPSLYLPCCHMSHVCKHAIRHVLVQSPKCTLSISL